MKSENNITNHFVMFGGDNLDFSAQEFKGAKIKAIFGGIDLDLRQADIKEETQIEVFVLFGGVDIKVPQDVAVEVKSNSVFGGVSNKAKTEQPKKTIYVKATCVFGGCDIIK